MNFKILSLILILWILVGIYIFYPREEKEKLPLTSSKVFFGNNTTEVQIKFMLKGVPILEPNDVRDRGENVRIKIDIGNEQVLWFIPKRDIVFFKEFFDGLYKIFLKEKK
jgi:hypothetical protein